MNPPPPAGELPVIPANGGERVLDRVTDGREEGRKGNERKPRKAKGAQKKAKESQIDPREPKKAGKKAKES